MKEAGNFQVHQGKTMKRFGSALALLLTCGVATALPFQNGSFESAHR